jgi:hypothetical protein
MDDFLPVPIDTGLGAGLPPGKIIERTPPDVTNARRELVTDWIKKIEEAEGHWDKTFKAMRKDAAFAAGNQWRGIKSVDRYTANITLRHINQRVSSIYAKNPRVRAQRLEKLWLTLWDGTPEMELKARAEVDRISNLPPLKQQPEMANLQKFQALIAEVDKVKAEKQKATRMAKTLELVAQYSLDQPTPRFKIQAKQLVRRVLTCKVGFLKLGYQRIMEPTPEIDAKIKDTTDRLLHLQALATNMADEIFTPESKEAEELKLNLAALQAQEKIIQQEGLVFSFPKPWAVIIDPNCSQLKGFIGAAWVAEKYVFTPMQVQEIYNIDVGKNFTAYSRNGIKGGEKKADRDISHCAVYEVYDLTGGVSFTVIAGYEDFAKEPGEPDVFLEQFHPYFALSFNDTEDPESIYPPSDVELIRSMAMEYNRAREGLRTHRVANTPATVTAAGVFDQKTKDSLALHEPHEIIETTLSKNDDINRLMVPKPVTPIQPELYGTEEIFLDIQRVVGAQSADFGGTAGASATEVSVADASRMSTLQSNVDDLDEFLTDAMRAAGQILFLEMGGDKAKEIAGPGAVWPEIDREEAAKELVLSVKAGSSGRPNKAARMAAIEKLGPLLMQIPGVKPKKIGEFMVAELDENIDIEDFFDVGLPSMVAMNAQAQPNLAGQVAGPETAAAGAMNAPAPVESGAKTQNMNPGAIESAPAMTQ